MGVVVSKGYEHALELASEEYAGSLKRAPQTHALVLSSVRRSSRNVLMITKRLWRRLGPSKWTRFQATYGKTV